MCTQQSVPQFARLCAVPPISYLFSCVAISNLIVYNGSKKFIDELNRQAAPPHGSALAPTGVPLRALSLLCCPRCGGAFQISKADMDMSAIFPPTSTVAVSYTHLTLPTT